MLLRTSSGPNLQELSIFWLREWQSPLLANFSQIWGLSSPLIFLAILDREILPVTAESSTSLLQKSIKKGMRTKFRHLKSTFSMEMPGKSGVLNIRGQVASKKSWLEYSFTCAAQIVLIYQRLVKLNISINQDKEVILVAQLPLYISSSLETSAPQRRVPGCSDLAAYLLHPGLWLSCDMPKSVLLCPWEALVCFHHRFLKMWLLQGHIPLQSPPRPLHCSEAWQSPQVK